ncbi:chorismate-binding protein [Bradyrhizobium centrosematis]|uniref:chorismate-binding protein n=1 Tax=Bradyrhizobium centrosematis TaxID=1300039 RepID=UPI00388DCC5E
MSDKGTGSDLASSLLWRRAPDEFCGAAVQFQPLRLDRRLQHVIGLILAGDAFQANSAQRLMPTSFDPISFCCRLRSLIPAPFAALLCYGEITIAASSPEPLLKIDARNVETRPIKGTIARCK